MKRTLTWVGANPLRLALAALLAILILGAAAKISGPPQADRDWYPYLGRTAQVEVETTSFSVTPVTDWSYASSGVVNERYVDTSFEIADLRNVWFVLEPQPGSQLAAHTLLLFEFSNDRLIGLTIEARREVNEDYSALAGIWNAYELAYVWGSARDLLTRRAVMLDHQVFVYPVAIDQQQRDFLLRRVLARTDSLETQPRYYNTIFSNCTNELAKAAGFDWAPAFVLTGRSDEYLFARGIIPGDDFAAANQRADMTLFIQELNAAPAEGFDAAVLAELRRRNGGAAISQP
jgi:hypothetical protein